MQRPWRKEDNNTSKRHSTGKRKEGKEQASKGLQNKVRKSWDKETVRRYPCGTVRKGGATWFVLNRCYSKTPGKLVVPEPWAWAFLPGTPLLPSSLCSAPWANTYQHPPPGDQLSSFLSKRCPVTSIFPTCQTLCLSIERKQPVKIMKSMKLWLIRQKCSISSDCPQLSLQRPDCWLLPTHLVLVLFGMDSTVRGNIPLSKQAFCQVFNRHSRDSGKAFCTVYLEKKPTFYQMML